MTFRSRPHRKAALPALLRRSGLSAILRHRKAASGALKRALAPGRATEPKRRGDALAPAMHVDRTFLNGSPENHRIVSSRGQYRPGGAVWPRGVGVPEDTGWAAKPGISLARGAAALA